jgi:hypothetical protein
MCNPGRMAAMLTSASIILVGAVAAFGLCAVLAGSWWTSGGNAAVAAVTAVALAVALGFVNAAMLEAANCLNGPCAGFGSRVYGALVALSITVSALIVATIVAAFTASIPYAGIGVAIAMGISAAAAGIALAVVSSTLLPALEACLVATTGTTASDAVAIQRVVGTVAGVILVAFGLQAGLGFSVPTPVG